MKQHMIDLLPDAIRTRSEAGMVIGRYITVGVIVVIALVALSTHAHFALERAEKAYEAAEAKSLLVLAVEAEAKRLHEQQARLDNTLEQYAKIAPPLKMTDLQTLIVNQLPESATLERLDVDIVQETSTFDPRIKETAKNKEKTTTRIARAELTGFALTDADVSELVNRLEAIDALTSVSVNFSKSRTVRELSAREFRVSFRIALDKKFEIVRADKPESQPSRVVTGAADDVE